MPANQAELRRITLQIAQDLSSSFDAYLKDKMTAEKLGHSIFDAIENMIDQIAELLIACHPSMKTYGQ